MNNTEQLAIIGDTHFRCGLGRPIGRGETFDDEVNDKITFLINTLKEHNINNLIIPGDIFDIKSPSKYNFNAIKEIHKLLLRFKNNNITIHAIAGNHDLPFASIDYIADSVFSYFVNLKLITHLNKNSTFISGIDYIDDKDLFVKELSKINSKICVIHYHAVPSTSPLTNGVDFITYEELIRINPFIKIFILGHLHMDIKPTLIDDRLFINTGSFVRLSRSYYNLNEHKTFIDMVNTINMSVKRIEIPLVDSSKCFVEKEINSTHNLNLKLFELKTTSGETTPLVHCNNAKVKDKVDFYINCALDNLKE